ncbi:hypothetical protein Xhom_04963 [Xenorhabdus hominickii]|uniref:Uncharacterized protein n=1 Tax=Xenorhabdus hominickii TaxID=351679 RepID=A0A2G0PW45_XENHO|nr:hypothetical protein Xhom_04963 [Xenorhabdus hominickii]
MKKYLLLALVAGTTLLASMQTYAIACAPVILIPPLYEECAVNCHSEHPGWLGEAFCL